MSCASREPIDMSGSRFGRAPTARLKVPSHIVVHTVNNMPVNQPLLTSGEIDILLGLGKNDIVASFEVIYEDGLQDDNYTRVDTKKYSVTLPNVKEHEVYSFDLKAPATKSEAQEWKAKMTNLGYVLNVTNGEKFLLLRQREETKSLREYMEENDAPKQLEFWWQKASPQEKADFKRKILAE